MGNVVKTQIRRHKVEKGIGEKEAKQFISECCNRNGWKVWFNKLIGKRRVETDAVVMTDQAVFVIEIKNLFGNIVPNGAGKWILRNLKNHAINVKSGWCQAIKRTDKIKKLFEGFANKKSIPAIFPIVLMNSENCDTSKIAFEKDCIVKKNQFEDTINKLGMMGQRFRKSAVIKALRSCSSV